MTRLLRMEKEMFKRVAVHAAASISAVGTRLGAVVRRATQPRHRSESAEAYRSAGTRVLILGAGFGGVRTALELDRCLGRADDVSVLLVDRGNAQLFTPLLWTVADGRANPNNVVVPIRAFQRGRSFHVLHAEVEQIDLAARTVHTLGRPYPFDILVIALGSVTAVPDIPGLRAHAHVFHSPADALELRNHVIDAVEMAHACSDPVERQAWLTFVVAGGGDTGVELAATIHDYVTEGLFTTYPWLADAPVRVVLVERLARLVPMGAPRVSATVRRLLEARGIEVRTQTPVEGVTEDAVQTPKEPIPTHTVFWAAGITAPPVVRALDIEHARNGAVSVDDHLRVPGRNEVYVVGDAAWAHDAMTKAPVPPTVQAAEHMGRYVAHAILAERTGRHAPPYSFSSRGHLTLLGHHTAVAQVGPLTLTGMPAWLLWHGYYLSHIPSWRNRVRLAVDWSLAALTGRETGQLRLGMEPPAEAPGAARRAEEPMATKEAAHPDHAVPSDGGTGQTMPRLQGSGRNTAHT
jgi:NADH:ubiquinone reductase (H+-translocating)